MARVRRSPAGFGRPIDKDKLSSFVDLDLAHRPVNPIHRDDPELAPRQTPPQASQGASHCRHCDT